MKSIHELLIIVKYYFNDYFETGLCAIVTSLWHDKIITRDEAILLNNYILANRPWNSEGLLYFWDMGDIPLRLEWLDKHIKLTE